jgi:molybdopterin-containing oxidoreductase family iron-sulfur binding subunit
VQFGSGWNSAGLARFGELKELAGQMRGGEIAVLLVHGVDPVYAMPEAFGFADALASVPFKVSFSSASDETTALADLVLPDHTPFEAWGDAEPVRGVRRLQQPTIRPIFDTRATGDVLLDVGRALGKGDALPKGTFRDLVLAAWGATGVDAALAAGGSFQPAPSTPVSLAPTVASLEFAPAEFAGQGDVVLVAYPSLQFYDGRSARFPALQELPDPVTKATWGSYAELHPETAASLGLREGDHVRLTTDTGALELPVLPHEAVAKGVVAVAVGQGHQPVEPDLDVNLRWAQRDWLHRRERIGVNVLSVLPGPLDPISGGLAWYSAHARLEKTGAWSRVLKVQPTFDQEKRGFAQATTLAALAGAEDDHGDGPHLMTRPYDPAKDSDPASPYRWGMSIDLESCNGCNACVVACAQENNLRPTGPELVARGREMQWIRIERYVEHRDGELEVRHAPLLCQHCGAAPCESVCPVYATYHNPEGLNSMIYNRCIGTRYCSNNCPYKVRRFNYLPWDLEVREPEQLGLNPDVTVRSKGVMEKCTFCVQRISFARDRARERGRDVRDGEVVTACEQACPTRAIVFGNLKDPESRVSRLRGDPRAYRALEHLYTRPAVSYLKSILRAERGDAGGGTRHG